MIVIWCQYKIELHTSIYYMKILYGERSDWGGRSDWKGRERGIGEGVVGSDGEGRVMERGGNCSRFTDWPIKKTILPWNSALKRCSGVETPQHRVLENTLNMGSYFTWIRMIVIWDEMQRHANATWARCEKSEQSCGECGMCTSHVTMSFTHLWYHVTMGRPKDIL